MAVPQRFGTFVLVMGFLALAGCGGFVPADFERPRIPIEEAMACLNAAGPIVIDNDGRRVVELGNDERVGSIACLIDSAGITIERRGTTNYLVECLPNESVFSLNSDSFCRASDP